MSKQGHMTCQLAQPVWSVVQLVFPIQLLPPEPGGQAAWTAKDMAANDDMTHTALPTSLRTLAGIAFEPLST